MIIFLVYALVLLVTQHVGMALGGGGIILLILFLINYYLNQFRGSCLSVNDLIAARTAMTVLGNYRLTMSGELWYSILYLCFFIALGFWCEFPFRGKKYHLAVTAAALSYGLFFCGFWNASDYWEKHGIQGYYWNMAENELINGFLVSFAVSVRESSMEKPGGYSADRLLEIAKQAESTYQAPEGISGGKKPNIIMIMNEAWSDLRVLGNLETTDPFMPFTDSLSDNVVKGNTYVEILGGLTANTEFEALTGDSLIFLSPTAIPYQLQVNHEMPSLAQVLREQGYHTMAMHPGGGIAWNRNKVYEYFGFEKFVDMFQFETEYLYIGPFLSDECNFNEIIRQYEKKEKGVPLFLFDVSIQNHGGYYGNTEIVLNIEKVGETNAEEAGYLYDAETYLNLMKITDDEFRRLVGYFQSVEEPTIICMFGDHQPNLTDDFYSAVFEGQELSEEKRQEMKYITPYVIWANYDVEFPEYGDMSANYLGAAVLECAGVELPPYYKFLLQLQKSYPVISRWTMEGLKREDQVIEYQMLQYNHLMEKRYRKELFSVVQ